MSIIKILQLERLKADFVLRNALLMSLIRSLLQLSDDNDDDKPVDTTNVNAIVAVFDLILRTRRNRRVGEGLSVRHVYFCVDDPSTVILY